MTTRKDLVQITIRGLEPDLKERLERDARKARRSLNGHVLHLLERVVSSDGAAPSEAA